MVAKLVGLIAPLGLDTLAISCALGAAGVSSVRRRTLSLVMVGFEVGMPLLGLALGAPLGRLLGAGAEYVAAGVLIVLGVRMLSGEEEDDLSGLLSGAEGWRALGLGVSVSLDELAVGATLGLLRLPLLIAVAGIAAQALVLSQLGLWLGARLGARLGASAERLAGVALAGLGCVLLASRLGG